MSDPTMTAWSRIVTALSRVPADRFLKKDVDTVQSALGLLKQERDFFSGECDRGNELLAEAKRAANARDVAFVRLGELEAALAVERERAEKAEEEVARWKKSFSGHVYVTNEDYSSLVARALPEDARERIAEWYVNHEMNRFGRTWSETPECQRDDARSVADAVLAALRVRP